MGSRTSLLRGGEGGKLAWWAGGVGKGGETNLGGYCVCSFMLQVLACSAIHLVGGVKAHGNLPQPFLPLLHGRSESLQHWWP